MIFLHLSNLHFSTFIFVGITLWLELSCQFAGLLILLLSLSRRSFFSLDEKMGQYSLGQGSALAMITAITFAAIFAIVGLVAVVGSLLYLIICRAAEDDSTGKQYYHK